MMCRVLIPLVSCSLLVACSANPGPAPIEEASTETTTSTPKAVEEKKLSHISVGIDPIEAGYNPHLLIDDSRFTRTLSELVLPSAFIGGELNRDLLSIAAIEPETSNQASSLMGAQTIRYEITNEAQWSDGTPITVSDFEYLWQQITTNPGTLNHALYRKIDAIRSTNGGKTVFVDLTEPIANWQQLFTHLIPSHLVRGQSFTLALSEGIPASGARYSIGNIDRQRGVMTLNRNDRFWGKQPAKTEQLIFRELRSTTQAVAMIENGQLGFIDITPTQTAQLAFELIPGAQIRQETTDRVLSMHFNAALDAEIREQLIKMIDRVRVAHIASGRTENLGIQYPDTAQEAEISVPTTSITLGVDPSNATAAVAARTIRDMLVQKNISVRLIEMPISQLFQRKDLAAVIAWMPHNELGQFQCRESVNHTATTSISTSSRYLENILEEDQPSHASSVVTESVLPSSSTAVPEEEQLLTTYGGTNLTGFCSAHVDQAINNYLLGELDAEQLAVELSTPRSLILPLLGDVHLEVLGESIIGPTEELSSWPYGLTSIQTWSTREQS
ncbi:putative secreted protein [Corynebacterium kutscheri]|uniref:Secreted protein n=1 Tax=Corynebacterium kutscheri TaxID=35755 RepID=A0AB38VUQ0_9CORY|nr:putative secreted protein [Corynebacterium kutscheri]VEH80135.1 putative secreted protein [Corynebacterium kutscheri]